MDKLRDALFSRFAAASIPVTPDLHRKIDLRFRELAATFRVPDHPPYASMICEAVEKLGEESGSTVEAISEFMVREHQNLPLAHNLMLDHHLRKLSLSGEIVRATGSGRYMLPGEEGQLEEKKQEKVGRKRRAGENQWEAQEFGENGSAEKRKRKGRNRAMQVLEAIGEANVGEVEERLSIEAAQHEELPTEVTEGGAREGVEVTVTESRSGEVFEGSDCGGEEFRIQVIGEGSQAQSQGVEVMTEIQRLSEEAKSCNEASMDIQANAVLNEAVEEQHEQQDQHVEVARKQLQPQEVQTKPTDNYLEAHGQENTMSEEGKGREHRPEVSETMQVSHAEGGGDRDKMVHFLERNEDESPMFPLQTSETRRTSCQDVSCVIKRENLKQVLQVIDEANVREVEEIQSTEAAEHKELPTAVAQGGIQAQTQGIEVSVTECQNGEVFEGSNRGEEFRIQVQSQGVEVMTEIQRPSGEDKSCNEESVDTWANAGLSEVAEEQHEPQDQDVEAARKELQPQEIRIKLTDYYFEAHGQENTMSEKDKRREHQTEVSETMPVSPAEGGPDRDDMVHFLERNEDESLMFPLQTLETRRTSCQDVGCVIKHENLKQVLQVIDETNVGEVEDRQSTEAAEHKELPTAVGQGGIQAHAQGVEVSVTECLNGDVFEGSNRGEEFRIQVQSQGVEVMTEIQRPSGEDKSCNEESVDTWANAGLSEVAEEQHEPQDQDVEAARKELQPQEIRIKLTDNYFEAHGQENTMSEKDKRREHQTEVSETMPVSPAEGGPDRDDMVHFLERNEDESLMFPLQTLETRRTSCQDAGCVIKHENLKQVLQVIDETNVGEVEDRQSTEAAEHKELPTAVGQGGIQAHTQGVEVSVIECLNVEAFEGSNHGEEFRIQVQSQGVEVMTEIQRQSEEVMPRNEASVDIQANAEPSEVAEEQHEPHDQHVEVARKELQPQEVQTKPADMHFEAHGQENTMSEEGKRQEHQTKVSETMQVFPAEGVGDRDEMVHFLERNEDESPMFPLQTSETRRTSYQDASCVIKSENLKQVLQVIDEASVGEVEERQSTEAAEHKELPTAVAQGGIQAQAQGVEVSVTECQNGEVFEGSNRGEEFRIQVQSQGVEVMTEIQRSSEEAKSSNEASMEEAKSSNEASMDTQSNAGQSEVAEEQHELQDQHIEVQTKQTDKHFEARGQENTMSEEGNSQEHHIEVSETMQVSLAEGGGDGDDMVHFLEKNEDALPMLQLRTPELVRQPGLHGTWPRKTSCQDVGCFIERENLKQEVAKSLRSQFHSTLFVVEAKQLMDEMTKMRRDMEEVAASEKQQAHVDGERLTLKNTYAELLEKTKKVQEQLLEFSLCRAEMEISKNNASKAVLGKEKKYQDEEQPQQQQQVAHEQEQQPKFPNPVELELMTSEESSQTKDFFTPPMEQLAKTRDLQKQSAPQTTFHVDLGAAMETPELEKQVEVQFPDKPPEQMQGRQLRPRGTVPSKPEQATASTKVKASTSLPANQNEQGKLSCRGRGRPPKRKLHTSTDHGMQLPKRGRGRPRKLLLNPDAITNMVRCLHKNDQQPGTGTSSELLQSKDNQGHDQQPEQASANADINASTSPSPHQNVQEQPRRGRPRKLLLNPDAITNMVRCLHKNDQQPDAGTSSEFLQSKDNQGHDQQPEQASAKADINASTSPSPHQNVQEQPRRGRGRPRKNQVMHAADVEDDSLMPQTKKLLLSWGKPSNAQSLN